MVDSNSQPIVGGLGVSITNPMPITQAPKAPNQLLKTFTGVSPTQAAATTVVDTGYTVPAGKTFYLTDVVITNNSANATATTVNSGITAGAGALCTGHSINTAPFSMINIGSEPSVTAGNKVSIQFGASGTITSCAYTVYGYEQ